MASPRPCWHTRAPFSFVDVRIQGTSLDIEVVIHAFDVAYELGVNQPDRVFDPAVLGPGTERLIALLRDRLRITADGRPLSFDGWSGAEPLPERQSVRLRAHSDLSRAPGVIDVSAELFPYDAAHQTFLNFYDDGALTSQAILGADQTRDEYFVGSRQGTFAVIQKFVPEGVHHILIGPDHLLFLVGLLLLGGPVRRITRGARKPGSSAGAQTTPEGDKGHVCLGVRTGETISSG